MRKFTIIFILLLLPLLFVGCGNQTENNPTTTTTVQKPLVTKRPIATDNRTDSYDFCEDRGYEVIIRFDEATQSSRIFCRFDDTTECDAEAFLQNTCSPGNGSKTHEIASNVSDIVVCSQNYDPVCGENKITYSNDCIASINKVKVIYPDVCIETQETNIPESIQQPTPTKSASKSTSKSTKVIEEVEIPDNTDWLDLVIDMAKTESNNAGPQPYINKCSYDGKTVYFQSDGCTNCYSVLYDENGKVICYPNNDLSGDCPNYFKTSSGCTRIWTGE